MCGIVLAIAVYLGDYLGKFATYYIRYCYRFDSGALLAPYFFHCLVFCYVFFGLSYAGKWKYSSLLFVFIRAFFFGIYLVLLFTVGAFSGAICCIFVFVPSFILSLFAMLLCMEIRFLLSNKLAFLFPLGISACALLIYTLLIHVLFRLIVVIV
jgi:hypothetical protein